MFNSKLITINYYKYAEMMDNLRLEFNYNDLVVRELIRNDLDIISKWPKYEYPFAWANFNIVNDLLKDNWMTRNKRNSTYWFVISKDGELIARGSLILPEENDELIFGMVLKADLTGRGLGTECLSSVMQLVFSRTNIENVWLETKLDNERARKTWIKVGFKSTGIHYRRDVYGVYARYMGYRLIKDEFTDNQVMV